MGRSGDRTFRGQEEQASLLSDNRALLNSRPPSRALRALRGENKDPGGSRKRHAGKTHLSERAGREEAPGAKSGPGRSSWRRSASSSPRGGARALAMGGGAGL